MTKQLLIRIAILTAMVIILILGNSTFFLVKSGGSILFITGTIQLLLSLTVLILTIILIYKIAKDVSWRRLSNYLTIAAIPVSMILSGSFSTDENTFQSKVVIKACYEGTMNTGRLLLREDNTYEDFEIGFFAHVRYSSGTWKKNGDTILLSFEKGKRHNFLSDTLLIKDEMLYQFQSDTVISTYFYMGD